MSTTEQATESYNKQKYIKPTKNNIKPKQNTNQDLVHDPSHKPWYDSKHCPYCDPNYDPVNDPNYGPEYRVYYDPDSDTYDILNFSQNLDLDNEDQYEDYDPDKRVSCGGTMKCGGDCDDCWEARQYWCGDDDEDENSHYPYDDW